MVFTSMTRRLLVALTTVTKVTTVTGVILVAGTLVTAAEPHARPTRAARLRPVLPLQPTRSPDRHRSARMRPLGLKCVLPASNGTRSDLGPSRARWETVNPSRPQSDSVGHKASV